jgi:hypothetical protein
MAAVATPAPTMTRSGMRRQAPSTLFRSRIGSTAPQALVGDIGGHGRARPPARWHSWAASRTESLRGQHHAGPTFGGGQRGAACETAGGGGDQGRSTTFWQPSCFF